MPERPHASFHLILDPLYLAFAPDRELAQINEEHSQLRIVAEAVFESPLR